MRLFSRLPRMVCVCRSFLQFPHTQSKSGGEDGSFRQDGAHCPYVRLPREAMRLIHVISLSRGFIARGGEAAGLDTDCRTYICGRSAACRGWPAYAVRSFNFRIRRASREGRTAAFGRMGAHCPYVRLPREAMRLIHVILLSRGFIARSGGSRRYKRGL